MDAESRCCATMGRCFASTGVLLGPVIVTCPCTFGTRAMTVSLLTCDRRLCNHMQGPLGDGDIEELGGLTCIRCPSHGRRVRSPADSMLWSSSPSRASCRP